MFIQYNNFTKQQRKKHDIPVRSINQDLLSKEENLRCT